MTWKGLSFFCSYEGRNFRDITKIKMGRNLPSETQTAKAKH